jgi:maleylpyruvate isomerase
MSSLVLHGYFRSSAAWRVRIALNLKGVQAEHRFRHLRHGQHRAPDYLDLNPEGLVPALELSEGDIISQSLAIIEYIDETTPQPPLLPDDPLGRARVRSLAQAVACDIHPINNLRVLNRVRDQFGADENAVQAWARHWIETGFEGIERRLSKENGTGRFCHGDTPTLADICLIPQVGSAARFGAAMNRFPTISRIAATCNEMAAFADARPDRQPDAE